MKKTLTIFQRDWSKEPPIQDEPELFCSWVLRGHGEAYEKWDGRCVAVFNRELYGRRTIKPTNDQGGLSSMVPGETGKRYYSPPKDWIPAQRDPRAGGKWPGWKPIQMDHPRNQHVVEAYENTENLQDGTYEAVGPKIQGNPHGLDEKRLQCHRDSSIHIPELSDGFSFENLEEWLKDCEVEGAVWHTPDGRMSKVKRSDFGFDWPLEE